MCKYNEFNSKILTSTILEVKIKNLIDMETLKKSNENFTNPLKTHLAQLNHTFRSFHYTFTVQLKALTLSFV